MSSGNQLPAPANTTVGDTNSPEDNRHNPIQHEFSLPPIDSGKDAWLFLAACWAVEAVVWGKCSPVFLARRCYRSLPSVIVSGFGFSFGVFQDYYLSHLPFKGASNIAVVGTTTLVSLPPYQPAPGETRL
jgi:hypothetical protein